MTAADFFIPTATSELPLRELLLELATLEDQLLRGLAHHGPVADEARRTRMMRREVEIVSELRRRREKTTTSAVRLAEVA
ncbi:hypothetical protein PZ938_12380 [Luteipulveratus sp. YIM 133132]|uniref:Uncharacterized protein n=1 Tax=Luteipulveratus flavus TaxID=3031728 RepID=A0ABT6C2P8_9MICO|nr:MULTISPECIES: hypothetical protein [unclassified Luteipulveratus]MDE9366400.1 hypothetical protein [Luteipulveratus sp. YIM 133132]MDF8263224.1 hypothetical protein [Luteipulveratus sp. YIM 133296]